MSDEDPPEVTREGLFEELFGRAKEKAGELLGNEHLAAEGRLQQAIAEAQAEAESSAGRETGWEGESAEEGETTVDEGRG